MAITPQSERGPDKCDVDEMSRARHCLLFILILKGAKPQGSKGGHTAIIFSDPMDLDHSYAQKARRMAANVPTRLYDITVAREPAPFP